MMWKTLVLLAVASVVLAGRIKKHNTKYEFYVKHDYDYGHHKKLEHKHEHEEHKEKEEKGSEVEEVQKEEAEQGQQEESNEAQEQEVKQEEHSDIETQKPDDHEDYDYPAYEFLYKVEDKHTHDIKGQHEKKYGDEVMGAYWLMQPDGYKRTVKYHANKHKGFLAHVDYSKDEEHDDSKDNKEDEKDKEHYVPKSEYYVAIHHGLKKATPIKEDHHEEKEHQEEAAEHIPIYVI